MASMTAVLGLIGGLVSAAGQAKAGADRAKAEKRAAEHNARILEQQAHDEQAAAALKAKERRKDTASKSATQTALLAADGQAVDTGAALLLNEELQNRGEFLADLDQQEGDRIANTKRKQAGFERQSGRARAKAAKRQSLLSATSSVASSLGSFF